MDRLALSQRRYFPLAIVLPLMPYCFLRLRNFCLDETPVAVADADADADEGDGDVAVDDEGDDDNDEDEDDMLDKASEIMRNVPKGLEYEDFLDDDDDGDDEPAPVPDLNVLPLPSADEPPPLPPPDEPELKKPPFFLFPRTYCDPDDVVITSPSFIFLRLYLVDSNSLDVVSVSPSAMFLFGCCDTTPMSSLREDNVHSFMIGVDLDFLLLKIPPNVMEGDDLVLLFLLLLLLLLFLPLV